MKWSAIIFRVLKSMCQKEYAETLEKVHRSIAQQIKLEEEQLETLFYKIDRFEVISLKEDCGKYSGIVVIEIDKSTIEIRFGVKVSRYKYNQICDCGSCFNPFVKINGIELEYGDGMVVGRKFLPVILDEINPELRNKYRREERIERYRKRIESEKTKIEEELLRKQKEILKNEAKELFNKI